MVVKEIVQQVGNRLAKESPTILTALGVTGLITTVIMAIEATPKAISLIIETENHKLIQEGNSFYVELTPFEKIKLVYPYYVPTTISGLLTIACIVGSNSINSRRNAALATLYSVAETGLKEYQNKVIEVVGKNKAGKIRDEIAQDNLDKNPVEDRTVILTSKGDHLFFDTFSGRYFKSDVETIRQAQNEFNKELLTDMYKPINEFYDMIELEEIETGRNIGWNVDYGLLDISFSTKLATNNEPCIVMNYNVYPKYL